jgi:hypothetical protein
MGCNASACGRAARPGMAKGPHAAAFQAACDNAVEDVNSALEDGMPIDTTDQVRALHATRTRALAGAQRRLPSCRARAARAWQRAWRVQRRTLARDSTARRRHCSASGRPPLIHVFLRWAGRQQDGYTLLHHAVATNSVAVARLLVKNGASVVIKTFRVRAAAARPHARMTPALCRGTSLPLSAHASRPDAACAPPAQRKETPLQLARSEEMRDVLHSGDPGAHRPPAVAHHAFPPFRCGPSLSHAPHGRWGLAPRCAASHAHALALHARPQS